MTTKANLYVDQGVDYLISLDLFTNDGQEFFADDKTFYCDVKKVFSETKSFSMEARVVTTDELTNNLELFISTETTRNVAPGKYTYDVLMVSSNGGVSKILEGLMTIIPTNTLIGANT